MWAEMGMRARSELMSALLDRQQERAVLDGLLGDLRSGRGRALVVRGEAGVGKSALLEYVAGAAAGMRVARAAGAESEMELAFAGAPAAVSHPPAAICEPRLRHAQRLVGHLMRDAVLRPLGCDNPATATDCPSRPGPRGPPNALGHRVLSPTRRSPCTAGPVFARSSSPSAPALRRGGAGQH